MSEMRSVSSLTSYADYEKQQAELARVTALVDKHGGSLGALAKKCEWQEAEIAALRVVIAGLGNTAALKALRIAAERATVRGATLTDATDELAEAMRTDQAD